MSLNEGGRPENCGGVWVIIPVHNRREITRTCLTNLRELALPRDCQICVIDDGCTDGTSEMLRDEFPEVRTVVGDGNLFWGGGIAAGMRVALEARAEVHVWLNDDCLPVAEAIETVVSRVRETKGVCGAVCYDPDHPNKVTYSGAKIGVSGIIAPPAGYREEVDMLNGNLVAIHCSVVEELGVVDEVRFPHYGGDIEYCIRARGNGRLIEISGDARALNPRGTPLARFGVDKPAHAIFCEPFRVASSIYWPAYWRILKLSFGWKAYLRWPSYFVRLVGLWTHALRRVSQ